MFKFELVAQINLQNERFLCTNHPLMLCEHFQNMRYVNIPFLPNSIPIIVFKTQNVVVNCLKSQNYFLIRLAGNFVLVLEVLNY